MIIHTSRLELIPCSLDFAQTIIIDKTAAEKLIDAHVPDEWMTGSLQHYLPVYLQQLQADPEMLMWGIWLMIQREERVMVGDIGFKGKPDSAGTIDLGYKVLSAYRRQGYAYEAAQALVDWAFKQPRVKRIIAQTLVDNMPSIRVLEKLGMQRIRVEDDYIHWELKSGIKISGSI
jgi:[ribosomal protein S5]-alanine N-acetyltransferase